MKKLVARDHREAYDYWARYSDDPALMANREAGYTRFKVANVAAMLPLQAGSRVLDVGPGDGALFRLIASRVASCCGVDPSPTAVERLNRMFSDLGNVEFRVGSGEELPFPDDAFDVVVMNSVLLILPSPESASRCLGELVRVCRPGGTVFVGEVPFTAEGEGGLRGYLGRKYRELGPVLMGKHLFRTYARPLLRGEPLVVGPMLKTLHFGPEEFAGMARSHGALVECHIHREPRGPSTTRNDYLLRVPPVPPVPPG